MSADRPRIRIEPCPKRIRGYRDGRLVLDSTDVRYVWEVPYYPAWYVPVADVRADLKENGEVLRSPRRGDGTRYDLVVDGEVVPDAAWRHVDSPVAELSDLVRIEWDALDTWFEEEVEVFVRPRSPEVRVGAEAAMEDPTMDDLIDDDATDGDPTDGDPTRWRLGAGDARLAFLRRLGFEGVAHDSHVPFLAHLVGTARTLRSWGCRPALCDAGLFHSVYGTEYFELDEGASADEVRSVIGPEAERVAWLWCTIERNSLDVGARTAVDRHTGATLELSAADVEDVATLWAADTVEQIARMAADERDFAAGLPAVLDAATPAARAAVATVRGLLPSG
ncbi:MAG: DUF427 domain-containing protein [Microthrixaceae bacterium]|nr:DUF427 domain-containing protein [Microthrixaceae bacterium]